MLPVAARWAFGPTRLGLLVFQEKSELCFCGTFHRFLCAGSHLYETPFKPNALDGPRALCLQPWPWQVQALWPSIQTSLPGAS